MRFVARSKAALAAASCVIVGARFQALDPVTDQVTRGEDNDRQRIAAAAKFAPFSDASDTHLRRRRPIETRSAQ
jgi:hypothetical protein